MLGFETERQAQRGADRAAMRDGDDVTAAMRLGELKDRPGHPRHQIGETLAARHALIRRRMPKPVERAAARVAQLVVGHALPIAEILLGQIGIAAQCGPGMLSGPGKPARTIACAVSCVRRRLLVTQTAFFGNCRARPANTAASLQSQGMSFWP